MNLKYIMEYAPKGISNLGNTCYLNACIQILVHLKPLNGIVKSLKNINPTRMELQMWRNWSDIIDIFENGNPKELLCPNGLINSIENVSKNKKLTFFQNMNTQEDIGEFLLFFINSLHECISREIKVTVSGLSKNQTDNLAIEVFKKLKQNYEKQYSEIADVFTGITISSISNLQSKEVHSHNVETFVVLDLPIKMADCTLYQCIDDYIMPEVLDGENKWFNEKTNGYEDIEKNICFWSFPKILIISLKRNNYDGNKNTFFVDYPLLLNLSKYVVGYKKTDNVYDLVGICAHIGDVNNGHYIAFVKKDNWFFCNDEVIQNVEDENHLRTKYAYCLFYVKK